MLDLAAGIRYPHKLPNINSNYGELRANGYELKRGMSETQELITKLWKVTSVLMDRVEKTRFNVTDNIIGA